MTEQDLFIAARRLSLEERAAYLTKTCGTDATLRERVEQLLAADAGPTCLLDRGFPSDLRQSLFSTSDSHTTATHAVARTLPLSLQSSDAPSAIGRLGHFDLLEVIGHGGFGIVYRARDAVLLRPVAVKVLHPQLALHPNSRKRFLREARAAAAVRHANVVQVFAVVEEPQPFLVMDYIAGTTLQQRLEQSGRLTESEAVAVVRQVAAGLAAAHTLGLVHRDVKPANILLEAATGRALVTDFGQVWADDDACLSQQGLAAGTPMYMSPEQARGDRPDHRGDLFSLGGVLYAALKARPPFVATHPLAVMKRVIEDDPDPLPADVPRWLAEIVMKLLAKDPARRFASAGEVIAALDARDTQLGPPPSRPAFGWKKRTLLVGIPVVVAVSVALLNRRAEPVASNKAEAVDRPTGAALVASLSVAPAPREVNSPTIDEPPLPADPDRFAALWLMSCAGNAEIVYRHDGRVVTLSNQDTTKPFNVGDRSGELPDGPFELISVNVNRNRIMSDNALVALRGLKHLTNLQVSNCKVTDAMLAHFRRSTKLESVIFHSTGLTDEGLRQLEHYPALRKVMLRSTRVTDIGVRRLSRALPKVVIDWNGGTVGPFEEGK